MRAMILHEQQKPMVLEDVPTPKPKKGEVQIKISVCGICRTDLHIYDAELTQPNLPLILGHQIVGVITEVGEEVKELKKGDRVGVPWLGGSCQQCEYCLSHRENLCDDPTFTGYNINGGYAEYTVANASYVFPLPKDFSDMQVAPLLCGGLIGYRAYRLTGKSSKLGFYGFGSSAHMMVQAAVYEKKQVYAFTRHGDDQAQELAKRLGAVWAGGSDEPPPEKLDAAIIFAPVGNLVPKALQDVKKGGIVVCAGIHMSDIPSFSYDILWGERSIRSVANLTRSDGEQFLALAPRVPIVTEVTPYPLEKANEALDDLRSGQVTGSAVITI